ncbi:PepSY-associated TM helix domain-containing protein [Parahaliea mediterranea]|uniref:PepSY-associated TM helix domain-containing protein n=1 Tax=Parahaliea mediterranea TaxID=651086 RepID=A0A939DH09_9GAMM|nr:PepSY-associated TM helix domain-containing protein [Parahaliea mediterranea]MBN7798079.1 PepSY-associated TM helix domain-containing protein [Parahaliea mediterranea]
MTRLRTPDWLGSVRQWHWVSSALCLVGLLLFAVTGITLNHAGQIEARPVTTTVEQALPDALLQSLRQQAGAEGAPEEARLPTALRHWLGERAIATGGRLAQWSVDEIYLAMPRPGGDAWLAIDLRAGELLYEDTDRGVISYLNDLHKGRNTGVAWRWFIDLFSVACLVFTATGLWLLLRHGAARPATWPVAGLGLVIPVLLAILFVHR